MASYGYSQNDRRPNEGVVDSNCQVYGISNLFIAGAASFATSGAPNPTFILTALSLRLSNYLKTKCNNQKK